MCCSCSTNVLFILYVLLCILDIWNKSSLSLNDRTIVSTLYHRKMAAYTRYTPKLKAIYCNY